ncbi:MAG: hypothetical protein AAGI92_09945 [Pseudomonadota bacterium]
MRMEIQRKHYNAREKGQRDRFEFRALVALTYVPCLGYTIYARAQNRAAPAKTESVFIEALSSARAAVGYAYVA